LLRAVSIEFGLITEGYSRADLNDQLKQFLLETSRDGRRALLIVDESQNLDPATLEEIRLLSNLETSSSKLIQIVLFGQPELDEMLDSRELRQLRQRITVRWALSPLNTAETRDYVRHRLKIAAGRECNIFTDKALREVQRRAGGIPRLINVLCDRAMLVGYTAGKPTMEPHAISRAAREILSARSRRRPWRSVLRRAFSATILLAVGVGALSWFGFASKSPEPAERESPVPPAVAVGPPFTAANEEFSSRAETSTAEVGDAAANWEFE